MESRTTTGPLSSIRVLELGNFIAAPTAGRLLADFGAEVIKIERPDTGDELRTWRLFEGTTSLLYRTINRNKRSVALDLRTEEGRAAVLDLVRESDVVIENFRPGTLEKWGLGPEVLDGVNPEIVLVRISAYGQTGPMSPLAGFAAVAEAHSGFRDLVGEPDQAPSRAGVSIGDSVAGLYAAFGAVMLLLDRERRQGPAAPDDRVVDVALNEAMLSMMESLLPDYDAYGVLRKRTGGRMEGIAPSNAYTCGDGKSIVVAGNGDGIYRRFMEVIGRPDLADDPGLSNNALRWARRDELDEAIGAWTATKSAEEALAALAGASVPSGPINTAADIIADKQYLARGIVQRFDVDNGEEVLTDVAFPGVVPLLGPESIPVRSLGPDLGADTRDVIEGILGWSPERVDALLGEQGSEGVVA